MLCPNLLFSAKVIVKASFSTAATKLKEFSIDKIRNIGILAHIDAGKTTTTERMLYYSGLIRRTGEVHHGNTVTDYMEQERERGITITSAAVTFSWKNYQFNLIDTPGHIDFTMEVERTLNVLDGAIIILDGSAGVEAQTITVWKQADRYKIPKIVFVNKMDRPDSDVELSCFSVEHKLGLPTLCVQKPLYSNGSLQGTIDLIRMEKITYDHEKCSVQRTILSEDVDGDVWKTARSEREKLVDKLTNYSDDLANNVISSSSLDIQPQEIIRAIKIATLSHKAVPVFCGSSYKNIGVQPLMDAVIYYLPSPCEISQQYLYFENNLCAKIFKVIHDKQKGPLVFLRVYSGTFFKGQKVFNIGQNRTEQTGRLYIAYADDFQEVDKVTNGNIGVVTGLKEAVTGDLLTSSLSVAEKIKKQMVKKFNIDEDTVLRSFGVNTKIPQPVFFCSIEPPSLASQSLLEQALVNLQREDPSLRVTYNTETAQTVLAGMGELHLEIIKDRIVKEYKIDAELGPLQIAYRESPLSQVMEELAEETKIGNSRQFVKTRLSVIPTEKQVEDVLKLDRTPEAASNIANIFHKHLIAVRKGIDVALCHGPKLNFQVINVQVMLHHFEVGRGTSESVITATVTQLVQKLLRQSGTYVLEPIMSLEIVVPEEYASIVIADLSSRRCNIVQVDMRGNLKIISALTPLAELTGYSTVLRTLTSGNGSFTMEFSTYQKMSTTDEIRAISAIRGF